MRPESGNDMKAEPQCQRCESGPQGMSGHERLVLEPLSRHRMSEPRFVLWCVDCGTRWMREFGRGSAVRWLRAAAASGQRVEIASRK